MRATFETMGTVVSLEWDGADQALSAVRTVFEAADRRFSLYQPDSELSRVADGSLELLDASSELREVYATALGWRGETGGAFTPHRPDGSVDLNGIVKAWAMAQAGRALGDGDWCLNVGGDVLVSGQTASGGPWVVGIIDPADRASLLTAVPLVEFGSPKLPMIPDALVLNFVDDLDAKMQAMMSEFEKSAREGKGPDELTNRIWALDQRQMLNTREWLKKDVKPQTGSLFQEPVPLLFREGNDG